MKRNRSRLASAAALMAGTALFGFGLARGTIGGDSNSFAADPVIAGAGDISGDATSGNATAGLLSSINPDLVFTLGDNAYNDGTLAEFQANYAPSWGQFNSKVKPATGNHEYHTANAQGWRDYFGLTSPYYSYDIGAWHMVVLASSSGVSNASGGAEETWLKADLAANAGKCIGAYWHEPRFSSGTVHTGETSWGPVWQDLYAAKAALVMNGHNHQYERFAPQDPSGAADANGIREFVVGTGGWGVYSFGTPVPNSEVRYSGSYGVMKLTLHPAGYDWQFIPTSGTFTDSGSGSCPGVSAPSTTSTTATTTTTTAATTTTTAGGAQIPYRFAYSNRLDQALATSYGYNLIDVSTKSEADATPDGTRAQVWLYDYLNTTCTWEKTDAEITALVTSMANDPKVAGFYFSNEPDPFACPTAAQQHKDRNALIKSLAPTKYTLVGIDANWRAHFDAYGTMWVGAADYINYNPYICFVADATTCDFAWEDHVIQVAAALGQPFFVALQAFASAEWRWPTAAEETTMLNKICGTAAQGYLTFSWNWNNDPLLNHPAVLDAIKQFNLNGCQAAPPPTTTASTSTSTTTSTTTPTTSTTSPTTTTTAASCVPDAGYASCDAEIAALKADKAAARTWYPLAPSKTKATTWYKSAPAWIK